MNLVGINIPSILFATVESELFTKISFGFILKNRHAHYKSVTLHLSEKTIEIIQKNADWKRIAQNKQKSESIHFIGSNMVNAVNDDIVKHCFHIRKHFE